MLHQYFNGISPFFSHHGSGQVKESQTVYSISNQSPLDRDNPIYAFRWIIKPQQKRTVTTTNAHSTWFMLVMDCTDQVLRQRIMTLSRPVRHHRRRRDALVFAAAITYMNEADIKKEDNPMVQSVFAQHHLLRIGSAICK